MGKCRRGELYWADLAPTIGHEQTGRRPVLIIQNDLGNQYASTTIIAPVTSRKRERVFPHEVAVPAGEGGLPKDSLVSLRQIRVLDQRRLDERIGRITYERMAEVNEAIKLSLGLIEI